jgi:hypothetical protein
MSDKLRGELVHSDGYGRFILYVSKVKFLLYKAIVRGHRGWMVEQQTGTLAPWLADFARSLRTAVELIQADQAHRALRRGE